MKKHPESEMMSFGFDPARSENSVKTPVFLTSTFIFESAEHGEYFFENYGSLPAEEQGLIYSRFNHPNLEIAEARLKLWDKADDALLFSSGMAAISSMIMTFLKPGDAIAFSNPLYGGTDSFIRKMLIQWGVKIVSFDLIDTEQEIFAKIENSKCAQNLKMIYIETPANPTNEVIDIAMCRRVADHFSGENQVILAADNTYMGPVWQQPIAHGADLVIYSVTKYIGGHSDLVAGACMGKKELIDQVRAFRSALGNMASPFTAWMIQRSLETLKVRMDAQALNAKIIAEYLLQHPKVERLYYLGNPQNERQREVIERQCNSYGAMLAFDVKGGKTVAFSFLNKLKIIKLAVSLGSTESLAEHPASMTHKSVSPEDRALYGISDSMVRLSVGLENAEDLIADMENALA